MNSTYLAKKYIKCFECMYDIDLTKTLEELNDYTCNGTPGEKVTFEMAGLSAKDREEWGDQIVFTRKFVPKNIKYKFARNDEKCTNCQGFLSTIFSDDDDVIETITPFLHQWASTEVAKNAQALAAKEEDKYADDKSPLGYFSRHSSYPGALLGG